MKRKHQNNNDKKQMSYMFLYLCTLCLFYCCGMNFLNKQQLVRMNGYSIFKDMLCIHRKLQLEELYHMQEKGKPMDRKIVNNVFIN